MRLNCRESVPEAVAYGVSLALWQRRLVAQADAVLVPSEFAARRLRELGAPLDWERVHVLPPPVRAAGERPRDDGEGSRRSPDMQGSRRSRAAYALVVSRLSAEKGVDVAIDACRIAGVPLMVAGDGPELAALRGRVGDGDVRFLGRVDDPELERLRAGAAVALAPSRSAETFGLAAAEAMAARVPVAASRVGALAELVPEHALAPPGDAQALAAAMMRLLEEPSAGDRARERVRALCAPELVARRLAGVYGGT